MTRRILCRKPFIVIIPARRPIQWCTIYSSIYPQLLLTEAYRLVKIYIFIYFKTFIVIMDSVHACMNQNNVSFFISKTYGFGSEIIHALYIISNNVIFPQARNSTMFQGVEA